MARRGDGFRQPVQGSSTYEQPTKGVAPFDKLKRASVTLRNNLQNAYLHYVT